MTRLIGFALLLAATPLPALAQSGQSLDQRVNRVEKELKAVQRKVFPGGDPAFFEPEIAPNTARTPVGAPASIPLNDLTARVDSLERSVAQLTGQVEQAENRLRLLSEQSAKDRAEFDTRLKQMETGGAGALPAPGSAPIDSGDSLAPPRDGGPFATPRPGRTTPPPAASTAPRPGATTPAKPPVAAASADRGDDAPSASSGDPAEDAYMAGYKLWTEKKYREAESSLRATVAKYPKHRRASYAQNLLGRAYLDEGRPASAAEAFAANYQTNPRGERAPDSLYYLGQSLMKLNKPADACRVYDELAAAYGDKVTEPLKSRVAAGRREAKCKG